ncbi:MAG TPA: hypothetical protein GX515_07020 [Firmicutes bacterium]|nr:hypothetical protein [Bacillota bacterium]
MIILLGNVRIEITKTPRRNAGDAARRAYEMEKALKTCENERRMHEVRALRYVPWLR